MKEKDLENAIIDMARRIGWLVAHFATIPITHEGRTYWLTPIKADGKGFPDLVLVKHRVIYAELKIHPNRPSAEQLEWARRLTAAGADVYLWTDRDWFAGDVEAALAA